ncbi:DUF4268 domain-containing protein [Sphingobacterium composti Ten et al. 2007 non Yoo et al. 2007]|uniref:DUF4268 domain-containing protein n=1 Tax=Sphingobacterium composti TaxID=363260 RepID=UPI001359399A|nr:DUF4268 domain-containing protein [Sphingobacterium composti Ten et al. 2007 non Yoo et al. 2007]
MYSKEEARNLKETFWTTFGQYMSAVPSADGDRVNWVNYKTGIKHLHFRMDATNKMAHIYIEISHPDESIRHLIFEQFKELQQIFQGIVIEEWEWDEMYYDEYGKKTARISASIEKTSIFNKTQWPELISFFKPRIIALDEFWSMAKYSFDIFK